jgi:hypothetical protein
VAGFDLGKQVGPLPLGGWLVVVAGGLGIGYFINRNMANSAPEPDLTQMTESDVGKGGGQFVYDPPTSVDRPEEAPDTNEAWAARAITWLIAQRHDPITSNSAVMKFLSSSTLTQQEQALISLVLAHQGPPPTPVPPPETTPPPTTGTPGTRKPVQPAGNVTATAGPRRVTFRWTYDQHASPIGGFLVTVTDLKRKRVVRRGMIPAKSRSYVYEAPRTWTRKTRSKVQIYIVPFAGGFTAPNKRYGPGRGAAATPNI